MENNFETLNLWYHFYTAEIRESLAKNKSEYLPASIEELRFLTEFIENTTPYQRQAIEQQSQKVLASFINHQMSEREALQHAQRICSDEQFEHLTKTGTIGFAEYVNKQLLQVLKKKLESEKKILDYQQFKKLLQPIFSNETIEQIQEQILIEQDGSKRALKQIEFDFLQEQQEKIRTLPEARHWQIIDKKFNLEALSVERTTIYETIQANMPVKGFVQITNQNENYRGKLEKVVVNLLVGQVFIVLQTKTGKIYVPWFEETEIIEINSEQINEAENVHYCEFIIETKSQQKELDQHLRMFSLCSTFEYEVKREIDQETANYKVKLMYYPGQEGVLKEVLLMNAKFIKVQTPKWAIWLQAELEAMKQLYI